MPSPTPPPPLPPPSAPLPPPQHPPSPSPSPRMPLQSLPMRSQPPQLPQQAITLFGRACCREDLAAPPLRGAAAQPPLAASAAACGTATTRLAPWQGCREYICRWTRIACGRVDPQLCPLSRPSHSVFRYVSAWCLAMCPLSLGISAVDGRFVSLSVRVVARRTRYGADGSVRWIVNSR